MKRSVMSCPTALLTAILIIAAGASRAGDEPVELGPDVVMLKDLVSLYDAVPFEHKSHAKMAEMWNGCVTCHHRSPHPSTQPVATMVAQPTQDASEQIPACKSCHAAAGPVADIHMPNLKGAYHRQCLNCHQEWAGVNKCVACHRPRQPGAVLAAEPTPDDIVGRMHPPIPEPDRKLYKVRFTPADGGNVLFRHKEHTGYFGLKCINCHHRDSCAHCHDATGAKLAQKPLRPGMTWEESHGPCMSCHRQDRCRHCHFKDDQQPPRPFDHNQTAQALDADHSTIACMQCHRKLRYKATPACGEAACHSGKTVAYPGQRPGPAGAKPRG